MNSQIDLAPLGQAIEPYIALGRPGLLPALQAAQKTYGWLSEPVAAEIAKSLHVPLADVHGVIEFYTLFYNKPVGRAHHPNLHRHRLRAEGRGRGPQSLVRLAWAAAGGDDGGWIAHDRDESMPWAV